MSVYCKPGEGQKYPGGVDYPSSKVTASAITTRWPFSFSFAAPGGIEKPVKDLRLAPRLSATRRYPVNDRIR